MIPYYLRILLYEMMENEKKENIKKINFENNEFRLEEESLSQKRDADLLEDYKQSKIQKTRHFVEVDPKATINKNTLDSAFIESLFKCDIKQCINSINPSMNICKGDNAGNIVNPGLWKDIIMNANDEMAFYLTHLWFVIIHRTEFYFF